MCSFCRQKCGPRPKLFLRLDIFSTFRSVHILIFSHVPYIVIGLVREEPANFYREKRWKKSCFRDWPFVYFSGGSSLICWVTTQILICGNQTIWRLEIVLGTTAHPPLHSPPHKHTHTHQQKGHCLPNDFCPSYLQPHTTFFQFSSWRTHKFSYHATSWK